MCTRVCVCACVARRLREKRRAQGEKRKEGAKKKKRHLPGSCLWFFFSPTATTSSPLFLRLNFFFSLLPFLAFLFFYFVFSFSLFPSLTQSHSLPLLPLLFFLSSRSPPPYALVFEGSGVHSSQSSSPRTGRARGEDRWCDPTGQVRKEREREAEGEGEEGGDVVP